MFTGIIQDQAEVIDVKIEKHGKTFKIRFPQKRIAGLIQGASVAINGVCLTVTEIDQSDVSFDVINETLFKTNLGLLKPQDKVNIERSVKVGDEIGGHLVSGHVYGTASIQEIIVENDRHIIKCQVPQEWMKYIHQKGFITVEGASLTVVDPNDSGLFYLHLIPETLRMTTLGQKKIGDALNIELDSQTLTIVNSVERILTKALKEHNLEP